MKSLKSIAATIILILCVALVVIACSNNNSTSDSSMLSLSDASADVQAIYKARCINCHGTDLAGRTGAQSNLQQVYKHMTYEQISEQIKNGGEIMFGFEGKLTEEEIAALSKWLSNQE